MMIVESMFDGISCGQQALKELDVTVEKYYAYEIDKFAAKITTKNFPNTIHLGNVEDYSMHNTSPDLLLGGSPCQDLSRLKNNGKGLDGEKSILFYKFYENLTLKKPKYFLYENVPMAKEYENIISELLGVEPLEINSEAFSPQSRPRLYWTNIPTDSVLYLNNEVLEDIMEFNVDNKYYYNLELLNFNPDKRVIGNLPTHTEKGTRRFTELTSRILNPKFKSNTLTAVNGGHQEKKVLDHKGVRKLTPLEYERLQSLPDNYTRGVSDSQRYKMLGNAWNVETIKFLLKNLK